MASIDLNQSLETIGDYTFFGCTGVAELNIPSSVSSIGENAFMGIHWLNDVYVNALTPHNAHQTAFSVNSYKNATLHVPVGTKELYQAHPTWSLFSTITDDDLETDIDTIAAERNGEISVCSIEGVKLDVTTNDEIKHLSKGIYIVNGKKLIIK